MRNKIDLQAKPTGFTLIEILIALFIFAIISIIASGILSSVFNSKEQLDKHTHQLQAIQIATVLLKRNVEQMVHRPVRAANGNIIPALVATSKSIAFTCAGLANPFGLLQQSNLQRVIYEIKDHELLRITWPRLDRVNSSRPSTRILLKNITEGHFAFLGKSTLFYDAWPPGILLKQDTLKTPNNTIPFPRAIAMHLKLNHWGTLDLLIPIPSSQL